MQYNIKNIDDFFLHYKNAAWKKDIDGMINLYDDDVTIFDMWGKGFIQGLKNWAVVITDWLSWLGEEKVNVAFENIEIEQDENIAFANAIIQFQAISTSNAVVRSMKNRISLGFIKTNSFWKVKHQHTSAPLDSNLKAILDI